MKHRFEIPVDKSISFKSYRLKSNLRSSLILAITSITVCTMVLTIVNFNIFPFSIKYPNLFIILILLNIIWLIAYTILNKSKSYKNSIFLNRLLFYAYIFPAFYLNVILCSFSTELVSGVGRYTLFISTSCLLFLFSKMESILLLIPNSILIYINLCELLPHNELFYNLFFNIIIVNLTAIVYLILKLSFSLKDFENRQLLLSTIKARDEANEKLKAHEKYVTDFFINISHDLKAPLNIIYSSEQLLEKQISSKSIDYNKAEKYINSIKLNSIRLTRLLNNVLDISKIDAAKYSINLRNLDIVTTVEGIADSLIDFMDSKNINLSFDTDFEEKILALDEEKLERIILNLLSNALKFTPEGGSISIKLYENELSVFVSVKDTGIGMDEKTQKNIFDRFVQGEIRPSKNMSGSGIGLSLVKSLMLLHGGDVTIESKLGEGSNFILIFPKKLIEETLEEDIKSGSIYPSNDTSASTNLEFTGLIK